MRSRQILTVVLLAFWVLLGPVGMALSGCAGMEGCDVLCGTTSNAMPFSGTAPTAVLTRAVDVGLDGHLPLADAKVPETPPKRASRPL